MAQLSFFVDSGKALGPGGSRSLGARPLPGRVLGEPRGTARCRGLLSPCLQGRRKGLGDEHRDTLDSGLNLASCQRSLGEDAEALELFKNLLEGTRDHQGR